MDATRSLKLDPIGAQQSITMAADDFSGAAEAAAAAGETAVTKSAAALDISPVDVGFCSATGDMTAFDGGWSGSHETKGIARTAGGSDGVAQMSQTETENAVWLHSVAAGDPPIEI